jgi:hypothetical protein
VEEEDDDDEDCDEEEYSFKEFENKKENNYEIEEIYENEEK